ncbi:lysylphosphatidylglycerol synthase domain-containing protein [Candidatus Atelocyanobacterium thalassae]|uniref:Integral membrane protein n=1 Tax=cyanobacterium endosymbiont of Braarudosphaera bigelowii TaxID=1285375 RepID=A0ABN6JZ52_9CHRO|nr:lysylphosphatidylglycerol synthase domain-containing protein [Candidatus Atelocyanobacterium thalassa]BDA39741.1 hypothetical protein CPARK_000058100 [cyanobacterium endosymbiont of Braarudosphaera bigelowii]
MLFIKKKLKWVFLILSFLVIRIILRDSWQDIQNIHIRSNGYLFLLSSLLITFFSHIWSGIFWVYILKSCQQSIKTSLGLKIYLITNVYKYLPGNIGHFLKRVHELQKLGFSVSIVSIAIILEPCLMIVSALLITLLTYIVDSTRIIINTNIVFLYLMLIIIILIIVHPFFLNKIVIYLSKKKYKILENKSANYIRQYPGLIILGEVVFILLKAQGFILALMSFIPVSLDNFLTLIGSFSFAWLLGLITPGAPGGIGIFEVTVLQMLQSSFLDTEIILATVAIFRIINILAEVSGMCLGYLINNNSLKKIYK